SLVRLAVFLGGCLLASVLMGSLRRAREEARREAARRRENEAVLRKMEAFKGAILESALDGIITFDDQGRIRELNPAAAGTFGSPRSTLLGRRFAELVRLPRLSEREPLIPVPGQSIPGALLGQRMEVTGVRADGSEFPVEVTVAVTGPDAEPSFTAYLHDLSGRRQLEDELRRQAEALREAARLKDEFLAMLAHELRNPLAAISSAATLAAQASDRGDFCWSAEVIGRNVQKLARFIDDLLDVSRLTHGKIELRKTVVDAATILDRAVEAIRPLREQKHQHLEASFPRGCLWLEGDATRLEQVVSNLLINAVQYSDDGGRIELRAERSEAGTEIRITVRDHGAGIGPELLPHVFELFAQGDRSLARTEGGLGIGLTVVKTLTELHGGTVTASSAGLGRGSEFVLSLPAADAPRPVPSPAPTPTAGEGPSPASRILVVDDNVDLTRGLSVLLRRFGYEVEAVYDGVAAIEAARAKRPEVVLLDIGLPGIDGYEVARRLRLEEGLDEATIIAITGYGQEEGHRLSRAAGFNHHLIKPVQIDDLVSLLRRPEQDWIPAHST
ncbi:MAG TPA: ATP-binding protein, partial [Isosphaeraceae bacterium]|nr:ATP-binding protein [Isosphaeraceae bacterium]